MQASRRNSSLVGVVASNRRRETRGSAVTTPPPPPPSSKPLVKTIQSNPCHEPNQGYSSPDPKSSNDNNKKKNTTRKTSAKKKLAVSPRAAATPLLLHRPPAPARNRIVLPSSSSSSPPPPPPPPVEGLDDLDLMICHEEFTQLVALASRVKDAQTVQRRCSSEKAVTTYYQQHKKHVANSNLAPVEVIDAVQRMKHKLVSISNNKKKNVVITRGMYPLTDAMMDDNFSILQQELELCHMSIARGRKTVGGGAVGAVPPNRQKQKPEPSYSPALASSSSFSSSTTTSSSTTKSDSSEFRAVKYPKWKTDILMQWMIGQNIMEHPIPNQNDLAILSKKTGLTYYQIQNWAQNIRRRNRSTTCSTTAGKSTKKPHHFVDFLYLAQQREREREQQQQQQQQQQAEAAAVASTATPKGKNGGRSSRSRSSGTTTKETINQPGGRGEVARSPAPSQTMRPTAPVGSPRPPPTSRTPPVPPTNKNQKGNDRTPKITTLVSPSLLRSPPPCYRIGGPLLHPLFASPTLSATPLAPPPTSRHKNRVSPPTQTSSPSDDMLPKADVPSGGRSDKKRRREDAILPDGATTLSSSASSAGVVVDSDTSKDLSILNVSSRKGAESTDSSADDDDDRLLEPISVYDVDLDEEMLLCFAERWEISSPPPPPPKKTKIVVVAESLSKKQDESWSSNIQPSPVPSNISIGGGGCGIGSVIKSPKASALDSFNLDWSDIDETTGSTTEVSMDTAEAIIPTDMNDSKQEPCRDPCADDEKDGEAEEAIKKE